MGPQTVEDGELCYFIETMASRWTMFPEEKMGPIAASDRPGLREVEANLRAGELSQLADCFYRLRHKKQIAQQYFFFEEDWRRTRAGRKSQMRDLSPEGNAVVDAIFDHTIRQKLLVMEEYFTTMFCSDEQEERAMYRELGAREMMRRSLSSGCGLVLLIATLVGASAAIGYSLA